MNCAENNLSSIAEQNSIKIDRLLETISDESKREAVKNFWKNDVVEIFKAFLIHDAINCTDLELRKEYLDAIDEIKQNKEALEGAKHLEHKPAKKG